MSKISLDRFIKLNLTPAFNDANEPDKHDAVLSRWNPNKSSQFLSCHIRRRIISRANHDNTRLRLSLVYITDICDVSTCCLLSYVHAYMRLKLDNSFKIICFSEFLGNTIRTYDFLTIMNKIPAWWLYHGIMIRKKWLF